MFICSVGGGRGSRVRGGWDICMSPYLRFKKLSKRGGVDGRMRPKKCWMLGVCKGKDGEMRPFWAESGHLGGICDSWRGYFTGGVDMGCIILGKGGD